MKSMCIAQQEKKFSETKALQLFNSMLIAHPTKMNWNQFLVIMARQRYEYLLELMDESLKSEKVF